MATIGNQFPSLIDLVTQMDPDGAIAAVAEILNQVNEVLEDMPFYECNDGSGQKGTIRSGLPTPTWRKLYGGVQPTKGTAVQVRDSCGMLEDYAECDKALADLSGDVRQFRLNEDRAHIEGLGEALSTTLFYGDTTVNPERFMGIFPRFNSTTAPNGENIIVGGGSASNNASIVVVGWGRLTVHGLFPRGSKVGLQVNDKGVVTVENADGANGRMEAYRTHYKWDAGLCVRDWRAIVRIPNIDVTALTKNAASGADLVDLLVQACEQITATGAERVVIYMNRTLRSVLRRQMSNNGRAFLSLQEIGGKHVLMFDEYPIKRCDSLLKTEATVS